MRPPRDRRVGVCNAPFASMYLDPRGDVRACCMNSWQRLGSITTSTLTEIWHGGPADDLRDAMARDDLTLGCEGCARRLDLGDRDGAYLHVFDDLVVESDRPTWPRQLELALSNACNLQCEMCNGELSSAIRIHREHRPPLPTVYDDAFFAELDLFLPHLHKITFLGGEPFLAPEALRVMGRLVELGLTPSCHVTTNGTQWSDRIERLVTALPMHVAVSVDAASAEVAEAIRIGSTHEVVVANVARFRDAARASGGGCSLAFCLMVDNWHEFGAYLAWADAMDLDVFVNAVTAPPRFSLQHLEPARLAEVVASLRAEQPDLGRNAPVWDEQIALLAAALDARSTPVSIAPPGDLVRLAEVEAGPGQLVRSVEAGDEVAAILTPLVDRPLIELQGALVAAYGSIVSSTVGSDPDGGERRHVVLEADGRRTDLWLVMHVTAEGGERWEISRGR